MSESSIARTSGKQRWIALAVISIAQLMVVLDGSIVNIALPQAQIDLGFSDALRQWVVTSYSLAFGALLLLGGRASDMWGRKRSFLIGLIGFAIASVIGGIAPGIGVLLIARALQGLFAALLAPAALSLLSTIFTTGKERATAFGVFSGIAGAGGAIGLILGGVLTEFATWRWTLFVNVVFAVVAIVGAVLVVHDDGQRNRSRLDVIGTVLASVGLAALVYGFTLAEEDGWAAWQTLSSFGIAVVLLVVFVISQARSASPLMPLRVVTDRFRGGSYLSIALGMAANFTQFLFLTYYLQQVLGFSPLATGFAFLPLVVSLVIGTSQIGGRLAARFPVRYVMAVGYLVGAIGLAWLTRLTPGDDYWTVVVPATVVMGIGLGTALIAGMTTATNGVRVEDAGVASALVNTSQQIGGSVGTALMSAVAGSATAAWIASHSAPASSTVGTVYGYTTAFWVATGFLAAAAVVAFLVIPSRPATEHTAGTGTRSVPTPTHAG
ncbi:MFS transporter [Curtobacterium flaccumfaciens]|uniref:MFS transporter n=1 Tax=Curtobacterium flaccumfaciens TaxID=2035 RepID=UPI003447F2D2